jgi:HPt (histidine-containing phosphotransfer) domain-containing protein
VIRAALEAGDAPKARLAAHTIKGMAANTNAHALRALAEKMEHSAQDGALKAVRECMGDLEKRFEEFKKVVQSVTFIDAAENN